METKMAEDNKEPILELIIMKDGKEECRYKPEAFIGSVIRDKPETESNGTIKASTIIFGKKPEILIALHALLEGLVENMGEVGVLSVLQLIMKDCLKDFMAEMKLEQHAQKPKEKDELIN